MKNILLVNPGYALEIRWVADEEKIAIKADYFPLGLATVAALTPDDYEVDIWDELVRGPIERAELQKEYDLVGTTSHSANLGRALKIATFFKDQGAFTLIGGPGVTSNPDRCRGHVDVLFIGEAELTWPKFLGDWESGKHKVEYRQIEKPDMKLSPLPDWRSILPDLDRYAMGTIQTTRGCPNDCEFCDVVYLNGRKQRHKQIDQVIEEVKAIQRLGVDTISFNDDNLTIDHKWAKKLLRLLIELNEGLESPMRYMTQLSIDIANDEELLKLLSDANFYQVLIGIESPNEASLKEAGKYGNLKGDLVQRLHKVLSYGIVVRGAMIVGFDNDDSDIFDLQYDFIQSAKLPSISMHMLNAPVGTRLWRRLRQEGRVIDAFAIADNSSQRLFNNTIPKKMTRIELMQGFRDLYERLFTWESFSERMIGFVSLADYQPQVLMNAESSEEVTLLTSQLQLDDEASGAMEKIFSYTKENAPYLMGRVKELVIQFIRYRQSVHEFLPGLDKQIKLEQSGEIEIVLDSRPIMIPQVFRKDYKEIFRDQYRQVHGMLQDKSNIPTVLVETFVDFLVRLEGYEQFGEYESALVNKIAARTCSRFNGENSDKTLTFSDDKDTEKVTIPVGLSEDVIKSVEQELARLVHS